LRKGPLYPVARKLVTPYNLAIMMDKTGNARTTEHLGTYVQPLLQWKGNNYYIC